MLKLRASSRCRSSGFSKSRPSIVSTSHVWQTRCRPTPTCSALAVLTASTGSSAACCALKLPTADRSAAARFIAPILGFEPFPGRPRLRASPFPRLAVFGPFRAFPSPSAVPRHRDPCLLAVFSSPHAASPLRMMAGRALSSGFPSFEGAPDRGSTSRLSSSNESVVSRLRRRRAPPDALLGFVPLQGVLRATTIKAGDLFPIRARHLNPRTSSLV
jgi:hypothetical protein